jgi:multiple sugar transport system permease protein
MEVTTRAKPLVISKPTSSLHKRLKILLGPDWLAAYLFFLPAAILLAGVIGYPFVYAFFLSFTRTTSLEVGPFIGLDNYTRLWSDSSFITSVWITVKYTFFAVLFKFIVGMVAALLLHRMKRFGTIITGLVLLPWIMPEVVRAITFKGLLDPIYGLVNQALVGLGIIDKAIPFLGDPSLALWTVIGVNLWAGIPFFTVLLVAGLKAIDKELYEAAAIDGAGAWRQWLHITLPGLKYVIIVETLLSTIWTFNNFSGVFLLTGGGPVGATKVYSIYAVEAARSFRIGSAVAAALSMTPFLLLLIFILGRYMMAGHRGRDYVESDERGPVMQLLYWAAWPFRFLLSLLLKVFWVINDVIERIFEAIGGALSRTFFGTQDDTATHARKLTWNRRLTNIFAAIVLFLLIFFEMFPFYWVFITSFKSTAQNTQFHSVGWPDPWTLDQYISLLGPSRNFLVWYRNTLTVSVITPLVATVVAALGAYGLTRLRWRGRGGLSNVVLVAYLMPAVLMVISIYQIFSRLGLVNNLNGLVVAYVTFSLPFALWLMMGYYASIPEELESAGLIDGCNRFQVFWKIILPLTKPALMAVFLFGVTNAWNEYLFAYVLVTRESFMTLPVGLGQMIIGDVLPWGELTAASMLMAIPVFLIYTFGQKFMVQGLTAGAVKGGG